MKSTICHVCSIEWRRRHEGRLRIECHDQQNFPGLEYQSPMRNWAKRNIVALRRRGVVVCLLPLVLSSGGCFAPSQNSALSSGVVKDPIFTITLYCDNEFLEAGPSRSEQASVAGSFLRHGGSESVDSEAQDMVPADTPDSPYECFSLLETMQLGTDNLASQARYERSSSY